MKSIIKQLFTKEHEINVDLQGSTLKEMLFNINDKSSQQPEEIYINSTLGDNHAVLTSATDVRFKLYHYYTYYSAENKLHIKSHYAKTVWLLFVIPILMFCSVFFQDNWLAALPLFSAIAFGMSLR